MEYGDTGHNNSGVTNLAGKRVIGTNGANGFIDTPALSTVDPALQALVLYPNPVTSHLYIDNSQSVELSYTVYDLTGKALSTHYKTGQTHRIDVSALSNGVYLLESKHGNQRGVFRFVKE